MKPALMATPILLLSAVALAGPAQALPTMPPRDPDASPLASALLSVRYHRHHHHAWHAARPAAREDTRDRGGIKPGQWQFTSELLAPAPDGQSAAPASTQPNPSADGGAKSTYMACITSDKAVPAGIDPRCKLDDTQRQGSRLS